MKTIKAEQKQLKQTTIRYKSSIRNAWIPMNSFDKHQANNPPQPVDESKPVQHHKKRTQPRKTWVAWPQF